MFKVTIWTDGSCSRNGTEHATGAWCAVLVCNGKKKEISGYESGTTNNRMELRAVIEAVKCLKKPCEITVLTDSQYVCQGAANMRTWMKTKSTRPNMDMWQELIAEGNKGKHHLVFQKVTGHSGDLINEHCDQVARKLSGAKN